MMAVEKLNFWNLLAAVKKEFEPKFLSKKNTSAFLFF